MKLYLLSLLFLFTLQNTTRVETRISPHRTSPVVTIAFPGKPETHWTKEYSTYTYTSPEAEFKVTARPIPEKLELSNARKHLIIEKEIKEILAPEEPDMFGINATATVELLDSTRYTLEEVQLREILTATSVPALKYYSTTYTAYFFAGRIFYTLTVSTKQPVAEALEQDKATFFRSVKVTD